MTRTCLKMAARASALSAGLFCAASAHAALTITDVGRYDFTDNSGSGARELSGMVHIGGSAFYAVSDKDALLHSLTINIDELSGQITSATISPSPVALQPPASTPSDREAIAVQGSNVLIASETGPWIEAYDPTTGLLNGIITPATPGMGAYANSRPNLAWESLANFQANTSTFLTANEDALTIDGPTANFTDGAYVRIQAASINASNATASAIAQFAYSIDPINGDNPLVSGESSGLVELVTLPDNTVLAMERAVGLTGYRIRIYQIGGEGATDVTGLTDLDGLTPGVDFTPVGKLLLWEKTFGVTTNSNFEGLAYVPETSSLILIADNASGPVLPFIGQQWTTDDQSLYSLQIGLQGTGELAGDLNEDGFVGIADLNIILGQWNQVVFPGTGPDSNVDGFIGIADLNMVLGNWNAGTPPQLSNAPEPTSIVFGGLFTVYMLLGRLRPGIH